MAAIAAGPINVHSSTSGNALAIRLRMMDSEPAPRRRERVSQSIADISIGEGVADRNRAVLDWRFWQALRTGTVASHPHPGPTSRFPPRLAHAGGNKELSVKTYEGANIRNLAVVGHGHAGKTSLVS